MKPFPMTPALLLAAALLAGCHKDAAGGGPSAARPARSAPAIPTTPAAPIVGKWQVSKIADDGEHISAVYEFAAGGRETMTATSTGGPDPTAVVVTGTYKVTGANLTQTNTAMTMDNTPVPIPADKVVPQTAPFSLAGGRLTLIAPIGHQRLTLTRVKP